MDVFFSVSFLTLTLKSRLVTDFGGGFWTVHPIRGQDCTIPGLRLGGKLITHLQMLMAAPNQKLGILCYFSISLKNKTLTFLRFCLGGHNTACPGPSLPSGPLATKKVIVWVIFIALPNTNLRLHPFGRRTPVQPPVVVEWSRWLMLIFCWISQHILNRRGDLVSLLACIQDAVQHAKWAVAQSAFNLMYDPSHALGCMCTRVNIMLMECMSVSRRGKKQYRRKREVEIRRNTFKRKKAQQEKLRVK